MFESGSSSNGYEPLDMLKDLGNTLQHMEDMEAIHQAQWNNSVTLTKAIQGQTDAIKTPGSFYGI